jgi:hypothetical protein
LVLKKQKQVRGTLGKKKYNRMFNESSLPFLHRPKSSSSNTAQIVSFSNSSKKSPRTEVFQIMNGAKTASKLDYLHDQAMEKGNRGHLNRNKFSELGGQESTTNIHVPAPPPSTFRPTSFTTNCYSLSNHHHRTLPQPPSSSSSGFRNDSAHIWWPEHFDAIAFNEQLERLTKKARNENDALELIDRTDVRHAFEALDLLANTFKGTPAAEILNRVSEIFDDVCFRPRTDGQKRRYHQPTTSTTTSTTAGSVPLRKRRMSKQDEEEDEAILNRDLVLGLELEVADLRRRLIAAESSFEKLRQETAKQVNDATSKRITTEVAGAMNSNEVAEATILRVQKESAEMATRLQQSLAQQQIIRSKLIDLGMRNLELRTVLEAQKRAATARSWQDVMPRATDGSSQQNINNHNSNHQQALDRSALMLMADVVSSSQTELANLVEFRQKLSQAVYGQD